MRSGFKMISQFTAETVKKWIITNGFPYFEDDDISWSNEEAIGKASEITNAFVFMLINKFLDIHELGI